MGWIDLRSDTVTQPTPAMRRALAEAELGDDVYGEDPTVNRLQDRAAELFQREAALLVPTGTMGNQIAVRLHTQPGQEVIVEERSHLFNWEMAAMAAISGCLARPFRAPRGQPCWRDIEPLFGPEVYYRARPGLVVLENTHNMAGGTVMTPQQTQELVDQIHRRGLPVHLDGARIFNAATALQVPVTELCRGCDSVMISLSKGLCAPLGSLLLGDLPFIQEARRVRKLMGGGMRQAGIIAAAGLVALEEMPARLHEDHETARLLAEGLVEISGLQVDLSCVETNIVIADLENRSAAELVRMLREKRILVGATGPRQVRFVTHRDVSRSDILAVLEVMRGLG